MEPIRQISLAHRRAAFTNIDTDQIIPARFLRTTTREGLGRASVLRLALSMPTAR